MEAVIAQWIRLHLLYCGPGFDSQAKHLRFFNLNCYWEKDENKSQEARIGPYLETDIISVNHVNKTTCLALEASSGCITIRSCLDIKQCLSFSMFCGMITKGYSSFWIKSLILHCKRCHHDYMFIICDRFKIWKII